MKKDLITFVADAAVSTELSKTFLSYVEKSDYSGLEAWLQGKGYQITSADVESLKNNHDHIIKTLGESSGETLRSY